MRYLDPRSDLVFRRIFGNHKPLCISLLNALLPLPADGQIVDLQYCDPTMFPYMPDMKCTGIEVLCYDETGKAFFVLLQNFWMESFMQHALMNVSKAYCRQTRKSYPDDKEIQRWGINFDKVKPVYALYLLYDELNVYSKYWSTEDYRHVYKICNDSDLKQKVSDIELVFVELNKWKNASYTQSKIAALWLKFFNNVANDDLGQNIELELLSIPLLKQAIELCEASHYSTVDRYAYEKEWDAVSVHKSCLNDAIRKGEAIGLEKGELKAKRDMARILRDNDTPIDVIAAASGLSPEEIAKL